MSSARATKKPKVEETKTYGNAFVLESTEERLMLLFDRYKARKSAGGLVDDDTLFHMTTWKTDRTCHSCFHEIVSTRRYLSEHHDIYPFFRLQRFKYNKYTPLATIRIHTDCMKKTIWKIATKQAYSITILPKEVRSFIRDILLGTHKRALEWTIEKN